MDATAPDFEKRLRATLHTTTRTATANDNSGRHAGRWIQCRKTVHPPQCRGSHQASHQSGKKLLPPVEATY
eukprot:3359211-Prymnesium_polylepis.3